MAAWHHQCDGHELGQTLGDGEGQGGLACCNPWGCRVKQDWATEQHNRYTLLRPKEEAASSDWLRN